MDHDYYCHVSSVEGFDNTQEIVENNNEMSGFELLISLVKSYPHLYNKSDPNFKDSLMKENSWLEIAVIMNDTADACKNKWTRLRERFTKEKRIMEEQTRSGSGIVTAFKWPLYGAMQFLDKFIINRKRFTNMKSSKPASANVDIPSPSTSSQASNPGTTETRPSPPAELSAAADSSVTRVACSLTTNRVFNTTVSGKKKLPSTPSAKRLSSESSLEEDSEVTNQCFKSTFPRKRQADALEKSFVQLSSVIRQRLTSETQEDNVDTMFGKYITAELKKRDEVEKATLKSDILKLFF